MIGINEIILVLLGLLIIVGTPFAIIAFSVSRLKKSLECQQPSNPTKIVKVSELRELISDTMAESNTAVKTQLLEMDQRLRRLEGPTLNDGRGALLDRVHRHDEEESLA